MKILTIVGARPQFIKAGTISRKLAEFGGVEEVLVHTGQHYDSNMSEIFFDEMEITKPKHYLGIGGNSQGAMTGQMIEKLEEVLLLEKPDYVLVYGDTNSTLAGAISASKLNVKIIHIEAGLRSFNMRMPEEVNRILTDRVSSLLFCPTQDAHDNLVREGMVTWGAKAFISGDVMQDGAYFYRHLSKRPAIALTKDGFILCTVHRAENTDEESNLRGIFDALNILSETCPVVLPLHPRTREKLDQYSILVAEGVMVIEPVGYLNMIWLLEHCKLVMTDSGGLQKEAFFFSRPCITLRDETEWVELVGAGVNVLAGSSKERILKCFGAMEKKGSLKFDQDLYGGGLAAHNIVSEILADWGAE